VIHPQLKEITLISKHVGETSEDFWALLEAEIGPADESWSETFTFNAVSPRWLNRTLRPENVEIGHGLLIITNFNMSLLESTIKRLLKNCERMTWEEVVFSICRYAIWEYE
jgi:hypothetical protein